jgi:hypothetical protein
MFGPGEAFRPARACRRENLCPHNPALLLRCLWRRCVLLQECVADTGAYYEIYFSPAVETKRDEYHHLEIKMANSALMARTRQGYTAQPGLSGIQKVAIPPPVTQ